MAKPWPTFNRAPDISLVLTENDNRVRPRCRGSLNHHLSEYALAKLFGAEARSFAAAVTIPCTT